MLTETVRLKPSFSDGLVTRLFYAVWLAMEKPNMHS